MKRQILLVNSLSVFREALKIRIDQEPDLEVCGEANTANEAARLLQTQSIDVVILDIALNGKSGLDLIRDIKAGWPNLPVLVLSAYPERRYAERALRAGAMGYVMQDASMEEFLQSLRRVARGDVYVNPLFAPELMRRLVSVRKSDSSDSLVEMLSDREIEVFRMIGQGMRSVEIGERLGIRPKTVHAYRDRIRAKLGLKDGTDLQHAAFDFVRGDGLAV
jgi:DNA-binding NarL/FixJ family response regulator